MTKTLTLLGLVAIVAMPLTSQTQNVAANNQMTVNGSGGGAVGPINLCVLGGSQATLAYSALANSPIILAIAADTQAGAINIGPPNNIVDLQLATLSFLIDGTGTLLPSPLSPFFHTAANGTMNFIIPNAVPAPPAAIAAQSAFVNPGYAVGIQVSAAFKLSGPPALGVPNLAPGNPACTPGNIAVPGAGDDTSFLADITPSALPNWFTFYGVSYSNFYLGSNGYATSVAFTTFSESAATFASATGGAKICAAWDDFNILAPGTLTYSVSDTPGSEYFELCWTNVPEFAVAGTLNSFKLFVTPTFIRFDYGAMSSLDHLVGLSSGTAGTGVLTNFGAGPGLLNQGAAVESPYQLFIAGCPGPVSNLPGYSITFSLGTSPVGNVAGTPIGWN